MDYNAMALFTKVAEVGGFTKASKLLNIPISTLSRRVSMLEKELGVQLLIRSTRHIHLTDVGKEVYVHCQRGLDAFDTATTVVRQKQTEMTGILRLSIPPSLSDVLIVPLVEAFQEQHPKVQVNILVTQRKVNLVEDGVDLALRVGRLKDSNLLTTKLTEYRHILVAAPGYFEKTSLPKHPKDLLSHPLIAFTHWHRPIVWQFHKGKTQFNLTIEPKLALNDYAGVCHSALSGRGIAEIPAPVCLGYLKSGNLVEVAMDWRFETVPLALIFHGNPHIVPITRMFKDFCKQWFNHQDFETY